VTDQVGSGQQDFELLEERRTESFAVSFLVSITLSRYRIGDSIRGRMIDQTTG